MNKNTFDTLRPPFVAPRLLKPSNRDNVEERSVTNMGTELYLATELN
jgi:hypothetical protein